MGVAYFTEPALADHAMELEVTFGDSFKLGKTIYVRTLALLYHVNVVAAVPHFEIC
jgi:hypothetical protein